MLKVTGLTSCLSVGVLDGSALQYSEFSYGVSCSSTVLGVTLTYKSTLASESLQLGRHWEPNWLPSVIKYIRSSGKERITRASWASNYLSFML